MSCTDIPTGPGLFSDDSIVAKAITKLFFILSTWNRYQDASPKGLVLEISIYSPSDSQHAFKGDLHLDVNSFANSEDFESNVPPIHDPYHGWVYGQRLTRPNSTDISQLLKILRPSFHERLPVVEVVKSLVIRRQTRRGLSSVALQQIFENLPNLEYINYEPWREFFRFKFYYQDKGYRDVILTSLPKELKILTIFEDFNEDYNIIYHFGQIARAWRYPPELIRTPCPSVGAALAWRSISLEKLFASYIVDAKDFFKACEPDWVWNNLKSLALTSRLLICSTRPSTINNMLVEAGMTALKMPKLQTMEIWNGIKRNAGVFRYQVTTTSTMLGWCGTWDLELDPEVVEIWRKVALLHTRHELCLQANEKLSMCDITSQAAAIRKLKINGEVIHPISLEQIERESKLYFYK
ncbi:hypothetical protein B7463_g3037, partial [Scytalidium lignicola]